MHPTVVPISSATVVPVTSRKSMTSSPAPWGQLPAEFALQLMRKTGDGDLISELTWTAALLSRYGGWRWVGVARQGPGGECAQMLAFSDRGRPLLGNTYELRVSPCATLSTAEGIVYLDSVGERFLHDEPHLQQMGVKTYAGLACRRGDTVVGHVMMMHDEPLNSHIRAAAECLLPLASLHAGGLLELSGLRDDALHWRRQAETDALTQLPNRHVFERELALQLSLISHGARSDSLLALFDVNGLKRVNDVKGHLAGDELLQLVSERLRTQLRRHQDKIYRIGGDEFALITDAPRAGCEAWLQARTGEISRGLGKSFGDDSVGLSLGLARARETHLSRSAWLGLADTRMYADKGHRRRA